MGKNVTHTKILSGTKKKKKKNYLEFKLNHLNVTLLSRYLEFVINLYFHSFKASVNSQSCF